MVGRVHAVSFAATISRVECVRYPLLAALRVDRRQWDAMPECDMWRWLCIVGDFDAQARAYWGVSPRRDSISPKCSSARGRRIPHCPSEIGELAMPAILELGTAERGVILKKSVTRWMITRTILVSRRAGATELLLLEWCIRSDAGLYQLSTYRCIHQKHPQCWISSTRSLPKVGAIEDLDAGCSKFGSPCH